MPAWKDREAQRRHCQQIGSKGGSATVTTHGIWHLRQIAAIGFDEYCKRHHDGNRAKARAALKKKLNGRTFHNYAADAPPF